MNTQQRNLLLNNFIDQLDLACHSDHTYNHDIASLDINENNLPKLNMVQDLMSYHHDITSTIENTYKQVKEVMIHMKSLKNRKKNVQIAIDSMTACQEIKKLSYSLGSEAKEICQNLEKYYGMRQKVHHMEKYTHRIDKQILELEQEYQKIFGNEMNKNNSSNIGEISKILEIIRSHSQDGKKPDTLQQIADLYVSTAKKEFKSLQDELFKIPIVGNEQSNYKFFDMSKIAMKIVANLASNCKNNVIKVSSQEGYVHVLKTLFELLTTGIIFQLLMRLKKYYQIDKITITQSKFVLKQKQFKQLQPYFKQYVAIWNQLERLRLHLLTEISEGCAKKQQLKMDFENTMNSKNMVEINSSSITFMQAMMRFRFDKLLKTSRFVACICSFDNDFFREINDKNITHNIHVQDFLEETMTRTCQGVEKGLQTLNTMIISAIINFTNHNLIYQDVFYAFNQLFSRVFNKLASGETKVQHAMILTLNAVAGFPRALKMLKHIKLPEEVPEKRIKAQLEEVVNNNEDKTGKFLESLIGKIVGAQWFRFELEKDYEKILQKWVHLESECFHTFVQEVCKVHAQLIEQTEFSKRYAQTTAFNFEKDVRAKISFYERYSHSILPHFKKILDYIEVLQLENQDDFRDIIRRFKDVYSQADLKRIWVLRRA